MPMSAILILLAVIVLLPFIAFLILVGKLFTGKSIKNPEYPPINGTIFGQVFYFNTLYDQQTKDAKKFPTFRLLAPSQSDVYTIDPRNVEHVSKTCFGKYIKGDGDKEIIKDLFGEGIFAVNGDKWRQQRKLASLEFSTRVLRDFSCSVFRQNAAKLVGVLVEMAAQGRDFDVQDILMRAGLDSIFKVGFGVDLNCLEGWSKEASNFMKAFDNANALIYWRYVDPLWKLKRFLLESKKDPVKMNDKYLRDIILNFMLAGKDSTGNTLSWFLFMLCKNPLVQENIFQEIRDLIPIEDPERESRADPNDFVAKITESVLDQMHYLHAALSETLRLYPAVPL
ncbi:hypothetical protein CRG98_012500, partial [Punica granatum]